MFFHYFRGHKEAFKSVLTASTLCTLATSYLAYRFIELLIQGLTIEGWLFFFGLFLGWQWIYLTLGLSLFWCPWLNTKREGVATVLVAMVLGLYFSYLVVDSFVYQIFRLHIRQNLLDLVFVGGRQAMTVTDEQIFLACCAVVGIMFLLWGVLKVARRWHPLSGAGACFFILVALSSNLWHSYDYQKHNFATVGTLDALPPIYKPLTMKKVLMKVGLVSEADELEEYLALPSTLKVLDYPKNPLVCKAPQDQYNILVLMVDALRYDQLTAEIMPNTYVFSQKAEVFSNYHSGGNSTRAGVFTFYTGLPVSYWPTFLQSGRSSVFFDELLKQNYDVQIFGSAALKWPEFPKNIYSTIPNLRMESTGETIPERDRSAVNDFLSWVPDKKKFFAMVFLDAVHGYEYPPEYHRDPRAPKEKFAVFNENTDAVAHKARYSNAAYYDDALLGEIFAYLEKSGLLKNTIVIFTSDHGESFNDFHKNQWGHGGSFAYPQIHSPFFIYWPGKKAGINERETSGLDVMPTLMTSVLGCENSIDDYALGVPLSEERTKPWIYTGDSIMNMGYLTKDRIYRVNTDGKYMVYDHENNRIWDERLPAFYPEALREQTRFLSR